MKNQIRNLDGTVLNKKTGVLVLFFWCFILTISNFVDPPTTRPSGGRWGWFSGFLWDSFGTFGEFYYWLLMSFIFLISFFMIKK